MKQMHWRYYDVKMPNKSQSCITHIGKVICVSHTHTHLFFSTLWRIVFLGLFYPCQFGSLVALKYRPPQIPTTIQRLVLHIKKTSSIFIHHSNPNHMLEDHCHWTLNPWPLLSTWQIGCQGSSCARMSSMGSKAYVVFCFVLFWSDNTSHHWGH